MHKLITLNTPYHGSPLAARLLQGENSCVQGFLSRLQANFAFDRVVIASRGGVDGAIRDLIDVPLSPALQRLAGPHMPSVPTSFIGTVYTRADEPSSIVLRRLCPQALLTQSLTPQGWPLVFGGQESDGIVSRSSQVDGRLSTETVIEQGLIHSRGTSWLGFSEPSVLGSNATAARVIDLLNAPSYDSALFAAVP